jgi:hypothetical protein
MVDNKYITLELSNEELKILKELEKEPEIGEKQFLENCKKAQERFKDDKETLEDLKRIEKAVCEYYGYGKK